MQTIGHYLKIGRNIEGAEKCLKKAYLGEFWSI